ncbi:MAG: hypothetical protein SH868_12945 [Bythopirellula sp.]|nr:hypothetical protein [Bythopirellula sp.]
MATAPRSIFRIRYRTAILLLALAMILWSGFSYWSEYSENSARRARELLAPPTGVNCSVAVSGNEPVLWRGKITEQSERWIVLQPSSDSKKPDVTRNRVWIPRERVESIEIHE